MQLRGQLLSALVAASFDHVSAGFGAHSFAKTVNFATLSLFGLIRSFHDTLLMILYKNSIAIRVARRFFGNALIFFACHTIKRANKVYTITARRVKRNSRTIPRVVSVAVYGKRNAPITPLVKARRTRCGRQACSCTKNTRVGYMQRNRPTRHVKSGTISRIAWAWFAGIRIAPSGRSSARGDRIAAC